MVAKPFCPCKMGSANAAIEKQKSQFGAQQGGRNRPTTALICGVSPRRGDRHTSLWGGKLNQESLEHDSRR